MMRMMVAAYALCAALVMAIGVFGATPVEAGYYRGGGYNRTVAFRGPRGGVGVVRTGYYGGGGYGGGYRGGYYRGPRGGVAVVRGGYYGGRGYYGGGYRTGYYGGAATTAAAAYYGGRGYYGGGYRTGYYGRPYGYGVRYADSGYYDSGYTDGGYTDVGYDGGDVGAATPMPVMAILVVAITRRLRLRLRRLRLWRLRLWRLHHCLHPVWLDLVSRVELLTTYVVLQSKPVKAAWRTQFRSRACPRSAARCLPQHSRIEKRRPAKKPAAASRQNWSPALRYRSRTTGGSALQRSSRVDCLARRR